VIREAIVIYGMIITKSNCPRKSVVSYFDFHYVAFDILYAKNSKIGDYQKVKPS